METCFRKSHYTNPLKDVLKQPEKQASRRREPGEDAIRSIKNLEVSRNKGFFPLTKNISFVLMSVLPACICVCHVCAAPWEARRAVRSPGTGITAGGEPPCRSSVRGASTLSY